MAFLKIVVNDIANHPPLLGLCAGYESGQWRLDSFVEYLFDNWLPEFCLRYSDLQSIDSKKMIPLIKKAVKTVYDSKKFEKRGEFGELLLHAVLRDHFSTKPAISKIYYKDSPNNTVKGFDAVHVISSDDSLELLLGEVKFYASLSAAIRSVKAELIQHSQTDYLRTEFAAIINKIDKDDPNHDRLSTLLDKDTSLDDVFDCLKVPVLLTYDSTALSTHTKFDAAYKSSAEAEMRAGLQQFVLGGLPNVEICLILVPLSTKKAFASALDRKLRQWQKI